MIIDIFKMSSTCQEVFSVNNITKCTVFNSQIDCWNDAVAKNASFWCISNGTNTGLGSNMQYLSYKPYYCDVSKCGTSASNSIKINYVFVFLQIIFMFKIIGLLF